MQYDLIVESQGGYIHARHYGENSYTISLELWRRITAACRENKCYKVLGETFTTNDLSTLDAFDHVKIFQQVGVDRRYRIAWVNHSAPMEKTIRFIETVLKNRGMASGGCFSTQEEARRWLLSGED